MVPPSWRSPGSQVWPRRPRPRRSGSSARYTSPSLRRASLLGAGRHTPDAGPGRPVGRACRRCWPPRSPPTHRRPCEARPCRVWSCGGRVAGLSWCSVRAAAAVLHRRRGCWRHCERAGVRRVDVLVLASSGLDRGGGRRGRALPAARAGRTPPRRAPAARRRRPASGCHPGRRTPRCRGRPRGSVRRGMSVAAPAPANFHLPCTEVAFGEQQLRHTPPRGGGRHPQPHARLVLRPGRLLRLRRLPVPGRAAGRRGRRRARRRRREGRARPRGERGRGARPGRARPSRRCEPASTRPLCVDTWRATVLRESRRRRRRGRQRHQWVRRPRLPHGGGRGAAPRWSRPTSAWRPASPTRSRVYDEPSSTR